MFKLQAIAKIKAFTALPSQCSINFLNYHNFASLNPNACHYDTLQLKSDATTADIKAAYLAMVKKYHPDHNKDDPHAEENFKLLARAYETLKDPQARSAYDHSKNPGSSYNGRGGSSHGYGYGSSSSTAYGTGYSNQHRQENDGGYNYYDSQAAYRRAKAEKVREHYNATREQRAQSGMITSLLAKGAMLVVLFYMYEYYVKMTSKKKKSEYIENPSPRRFTAGFHSHIQPTVDRSASERGETLFGSAISNNPLAFVQEKRMSPEKLAEEIAAKQFKIVHSTGVVRRAPDGDAIAKKWSKHHKQTIKDFDKFLVHKKLNVKKSPNGRKESTTSPY